MIVLDLKWLLFALLCGVSLALLASLFAPRRLTGKRGTPPERLLLDDAPIGLMVVCGGQVAYANRIAQDTLRLSDDPGGRLPSADWVDLLREDIAATRCETDGCVEGRFRTVTLASDTTLRWWVSAQGEQDLVVVWDVTREERVQRASRALISDLGHELRTPIATLLTHLEILGLDETSGTTEASRAPLGNGVRQQSLLVAKREAQRMSRLVNDMLELGRLESAETLARRPLDLIRLAEEVVLQVMPRAREQGMTLDLCTTSGLPLVLGSADRLRQALLNLLDNALKYAGRGARVTVTLALDDDGVATAVCDTGPGIEPEHLPRIGERFYRAAPETIGGSGLGLSVVREVLRLHRSELLIVSPVADGKGTCARFVLPIAGKRERG